MVRDKQIWILQDITDVNAALPTYREKNIELHLQAQRDLTLSYQTLQQKTLLHIKIFKPMVLPKHFPR